MAGKAAELAMLIRAKDEGVQSTFDGISKSASGFGETMKSAFAAVGALGIVEGITSALSGVVSSALESADSVGRLQAQLGLTREEAEQLGSVATSVFRNGFGESATEVNAALATVRQNLGNLAPEVAGKVAEAALTVKDLFGVTEQESTRTASVMMKNFDGLSETDAFDLITAGFQQGGNFADDLLDTMREYAPQFAKLGLSADQSMKMLIAGAQDGGFNLDKLGDGMKEFSIRATDGSKTTAEGFKALGLNADATAAAIAKGGPAAQQATTAVMTALANMEDPLKQNQAGVALFGTTWEDLGPKALLAMNQAGAGLENWRGATEKAAQDSAGLAVQWETIKRQAIGLLVDGITPLMPAITAFASDGISALSGMLGTLREVGAVLRDVFTGVGASEGGVAFLESLLPPEVVDQIILMVFNLGETFRAAFGTIAAFLAENATTIAGALGGIVTALAGLAAGGAVVAIVGAIGAALAALLSPIGLVLAAAALLGAAWANDWGGIREVVATVVAFIAERVAFIVSWFQTNWPLIQQVVQQVLAGIQSLWDQHGANIMTVVQSLWTIISATISTALEIILGLVRAGLQLMTGDWQGALATLGGVIQSWWNGITTIFGAALTGLVALLDIATGGMLTSISTWMSETGAAISTGLSNAVSLFTSWGSQVIGIIGGLASSAASAAMQIGASIISGIINGISAGVGRVRQAAADMVQGAISAAFAQAEAHSPSEVFKRLGVAMPDGMILGVESKRAAVEAAAEAMLAPFTRLGAGAVRWLQDFQRAAADYAVVAGRIVGVEREIKDVRDQSQTAALFRAQEMIDNESEVLRIKRDQALAERDLLPLRQAAEGAEGAARTITAGSLADRQRLLTIETDRNRIRLQSLGLEEQLIGLDRSSKRATSIQEQIDKLRDQDRLLSLESDRIRTTNEIAASGARARALQLDDQVTRQSVSTDALKRQLDVLSAEGALFGANEAIIKNATDNEVAYRERLIAVFKSEAAPLAERVAAGLKLVDQLEQEGIVSKELAGRLREIAQAAKSGAGEAIGLGNGAEAAARGFDVLSKSLSRMPDWMIPGSPTPFEIGVRGITDALGGLNAAAGTTLGPISPLASSVPSAVAGGGQGGGAPIVVNVYAGNLIHERDIGQFVLAGLDAGLR